MHILRKEKSHFLKTTVIKFSFEFLAPSIYKPRDQAIICFICLFIRDNAIVLLWSMTCNCWKFLLVFLTKLHEIKYKIYQNLVLVLSTHLSVLFSVYCVVHFWPCTLLCCPVCCGTALLRSWSHPVLFQPIRIRTNIKDVLWTDLMIHHQALIPVF